VPTDYILTKVSELAFGPENLPVKAAYRQLSELIKIVIIIPDHESGKEYIRIRNWTGITIKNPVNHWEMDSHVREASLESI
jgi:hypothetical protein